MGFDVAYGLAVVVTVGDQHHGAACGVGGLGVVAGIAHHQSLGGLRAQDLAGFDQGHGIWFFALKAVAPKYLAELAI